MNFTIHCSLCLPYHHGFHLRLDNRMGVCSCYQSNIYATNIFNLSNIRLGYQPLYVTQHDKIGLALMCTKNLTTFWTMKFNNFVSKYSLSTKLMLIHTACSAAAYHGEFNATYRTVVISYREGGIIGIM